MSEGEEVNQFSGIVGLTSGGVDDYCHDDSRLAAVHVNVLDFGDFPGHPSPRNHDEETDTMQWLVRLRITGSTPFCVINTKIEHPSIAQSGLVNFVGLSNYQYKVWTSIHINQSINHHLIPQRSPTSTHSSNSIQISA